MPAASPIYSLMMLCGIGLGAVYWYRHSKSDSRVALIYGAGLAGAFLGAKLAFFIAEGWLYRHDPQRWMIWLSGKSVMGALPGGWLGVEMAKRALHYSQTTGDRFARLLPLSLILGRVGCLRAGCCLGVDGSFGRWPAVPVEIGFQILAWFALWLMGRKGWQREQHFHLYLIGYGLFRFVHEFFRSTPKPWHGTSGYQWIALVTLIAALIAYRIRHKAQEKH